MTPIRLTVGGLNFGEWYLPPFDLREGAAATIVIPAEFIPLAGYLVRRLTEGVSPLAQVRPVEPPRGIRRWRHGSTASGWLQRAGGVSARTAKEILSRLNIHPDNLQSLAGTSRLQLALEGAWAKGTAAIVFDVRGLDPLGRLSVFEAVERNLGRCPAVFLSFPFFTQGEMRRDIFPNSAVIELSRSVVAV